MLVGIVTVTVLLSSMVTGHTEDFEQECSILKTLDDLEARLQQQEDRLQQQEVQLKNQTTQLQQQEVRLQQQQTLLKDQTTQLQQQEVQLQQQQTLLKNQTTQLQQQEALLKNQTALLQDQEAEIAALKQEQTGPVMFMARNLSTLSPGYSATLVFTQVDTNVGNGYDSSTGIFTPPVAGTYSFHVQFCDNPQKYIIVGLVVNNVYKTKMAIYGDPAYVSCHDMSYLAVLHAGDKVQAKVEPSSGSGTIFSQASDYINSFSGALMR